MGYVLFPRPVPAPAPTLVVAHRGASGYLPENTLAAFELAVRQGADHVELDLVMTADGGLLVRHENELGATTDVAERPRFADRRTRKVIDGAGVSGWFSEDFTLAELRTLRAVPRLRDVRPPGGPDRGCPLATFDEVLDLLRRRRTPDGRRVGVVVELKHPAYFAARGLAMEARVLAELAATGLDSADDPVVIQSFEPASLRALARSTPVRLGQLVEAAGASRDLVTAQGLDRVSRYAELVGLSKHLIIPRDATGRLGRPTPVARWAHAVGLEVLGWTFRRENHFLPVGFRSGDDPAQPGDLAGEIAAYLAAGMDSVITDNPDVARSARQAAQPPTTSVARRIPSSCSAAAARLEV